MDLFRSILNFRIHLQNSLKKSKSSFAWDCFEFIDKFRKNQHLYRIELFYARITTGYSDVNPEFRGLAINLWRSGNFYYFCSFVTC